MDEVTADFIGILFAGPSYVLSRLHDAVPEAYGVEKVEHFHLSVADMQVPPHPNCYIRIPLLCRMLELVDFKGQNKCCGFGGTFSVKLGSLSGAMAVEKVENIKEAGAEYLIGADTGCLMSLQGVIQRHQYPIKVLHIAQLLMGNHQSCL